MLEPVDYPLEKLGCQVQFRIGVLESRLESIQEGYQIDNLWI